jgi:hypothetical protein|tara:strand:+ start:1343 stop:1675 length:333 start_codon:yes stop_codon:yes gene_type:complete
MSNGTGYNTSQGGTDCTWITADDLWSQAFYTWLNACYSDGGGKTAQLTRIRKGKKDFQRKFIKLLCEIKGETYEETKYFRPNINVTAKDVDLVGKELKKINLNIFINKKK